MSSVSFFGEDGSGTSKMGCKDKEARIAAKQQEILQKLVVAYARRSFANREGGISEEEWRQALSKIADLPGLGHMQPGAEGFEGLQEVENGDEGFAEGGKKEEEEVSKSECELVRVGGEGTELLYCHEICGLDMQDLCKERDMDQPFNNNVMGDKGMNEMERMSIESLMEDVIKHAPADVRAVIEEVECEKRWVGHSHSNSHGSEYGFQHYLQRQYYDKQTKLNNAR